MFSVGKPPPSDPSSPKSHHDTPQPHNLPLPELAAAAAAAPPKFSIRDYVFTARSKDIETNWPFSLKNLQLCRKHGVKDVLPPFQPLAAVRNQIFRRSCTVENEDLRNIIIDADGEPSGADDHDHEHDHDHAVLLDSFHSTQQLKEKLAIVACVDTITSCRSGSNDHFPSTTTSVCQSEIEESVPTNYNRSTSSPIQTDTSLEVEAEVEAEAEAAVDPRVTHYKTQSTAPTSTSTSASGKKCRLILKFSSQSDRSSTEDIASNCTNPSEAMASKICPVCKIFSSSSNTTLNAHIDQCLSVESTTPKWTVDSKLTRHRIKPRKTKLMVDIYATAPHCTLEDLDRRNGSNWAAVSSFPSQESEMPAAAAAAEDAKQRLSPHRTSTSVDVGAVYIDANGIKLRILSKSDDAPSPSLSLSKVMDHLRPRKPFKGSKFLTTGKKKRRASKYNNYLKLAQTKKSLSSTNPRSSQICGGQRKGYGAGGSFEEERCNMRQRQQQQQEVNPCNSGTLRQWVCSKRTGVAKKLNNKVSHHQHVQSRWHVPADLGVESEQSRCHIYDSVEDKNREEELILDLSGNPVSSPENSDELMEKENAFYRVQASLKEERSPVMKRAGSSLLSGTTRIRGNAPPMKRNARQLRNGTTSVNDYHMLKPPTTCTIDNSDPPPGINTKPSRTRSCHSSRSKAARKNMFSTRREAVTESNSDIVANKCSALRKSQVHLMTQIDEKVVPWYSEAVYDFKHNFVENQSGREDINIESSLCRDRDTGFVEIRKNTGVLSISGRKEALVSESSQLPSQCYSYDEVENIESSSLDKVDDVGPICKNFQRSMDDIVPQSSCKISVRETVAGLHKSGDPVLKLGNRSKIRSNSYDVEVLTGPTGPSFVGGQEMFYADQLGNGGMLVQNVNIGEELDSEVGQGSSFPEVDPIPIPGPPGSFLPSPRDMGSDDFQGNSSLTTSRVQSSQDQHDFIDGDSSDSPISATSTISNSTASRDERKYSELLPSVGPESVQEKIRSSLSGGSVDSSIENVAAVAQTTSTAAERPTFDKERFKVNKIPLGFKSDDEPCCCQRKERASQGVILNYQESQLLRRRAMGSVILPAATEKQTSCNLNSRPNNVEARSDMFSPSSCPSSKSEKVVLPVSKSPASQNILRRPADAGVKFSGRSDCDSISPSSSNSILRLMGKNLMVVNRDQDESMPPLGQAQPQSQINQLTPQFPTISGSSPSSIQNQVYHSFHPSFHRGSVMLGEDPHNAERQCVDARFSNSMRSHSSPRTSQMLCQVASCSFPNQHTDGGFVAPMELREFKADYPQKKSKNGPIGAPILGHMERVITVPEHQYKNALSAANPIKEIITIDDVPESEAALSGDVAKYSSGLGESHVVSSGINVNPSYNTKCASPFYNCQSQDQSLLPESALGHSTGFHSLPSRRANASPVRWSCTSDGSSVLQKSPFIATSSSRGHLRSALYNRQSLL